VTVIAVFALTLGALFVRDKFGDSPRPAALAGARTPVTSRIAVRSGQLQTENAVDSPLDAEIRPVISDLGAGAHYRAVTRDGALVGMEVQTGSKPILAIRYVMPNGLDSYYTIDGREIPVSFLPSPVLAPHVSSGFGRRQDPWWRRLNLHGGIDYAARIGTPVHAVADGIVEFAGPKGGYGNLVVIAHRNRIETLYGHLSGYPAGFGAGHTVRRGAVIGYVGRSGLATGPHLHFEVHVDGRPRNPEAMLTGTAGSIPPSLQSGFFRQTTLILDALQRDALLSK
jgi:murein DD-endopeptidase MepM/ murein hydrolase activator NlpD